MKALASAREIGVTTIEIPQTIPYIPAADEEVLLAWYRQILKTGILVNGPFTNAFEEETARIVGVAHAVALNSCTSALQCILEYIGVTGKKVIVPANTFIASANAVIFAGGTPVIADIGEDLLLDVDKAKLLVDSEVRAIMLVHIAGYIHPRIEEIRAFCNERNIYLIEDAAHAHGASLGGKQAGSFGFAGAFSYYASKVVATGAGGMLVTNDDGLAKRARSVRFHGEDHVRGIQNRLGHDWLMTEFQAALGLAQMRRLSQMVERRMEIAREYDRALSELKRVRIFPLARGSLSGYYKYPVLLKEPLQKEVIKASLEKLGIATGNSYWPPIHLQPVYRDRFGYLEGSFPVAERILGNVITLPLYPSMRPSEVECVLLSFLNEVKGQ